MANIVQEEGRLARMAREIVLDTETTGLDPFKGHRLVEIGCVELVNCIPTGREFHCYLNPERDMPQAAFAVHGLSETFLAQFETFAVKAQEWLGFIADAPLIIHNASFDLKFLNAELSWLGLAELANPIKDTLMMARKKFPGSPASLDALCRRFGIDNKARDRHGALLDAQLLAGVYLELSGGKQPALVFQKNLESMSTGETLGEAKKVERPVRPARSFPVAAKTFKRHQALMAELQAPVWELPDGATRDDED